MAFFYLFVAFLFSNNLNAIEINVSENKKLSSYKIECVTYINKLKENELLQHPEIQESLKFALRQIDKETNIQELDFFMLDILWHFDVIDEVSNRKGQKSEK